MEQINTNNNENNTFFAKKTSIRLGNAQINLAFRSACTTLRACALEDRRRLNIKKE